jgi:hypothetical protein
MVYEVEDGKLQNSYPLTPVVETFTQISTWIEEGNPSVVISDTNPQDTLSWEVKLPDLEDAQMMVREERNSLLAASDWTQMPDSSLSVSGKTDWSVYRQALRDITELPDWAHNPTYPEKP